MLPLEIITLVKNNQVGLQSTYSSVMAQTHQNWLMTIVVGDSSDKSLEIAYELAMGNPKVKVVKEKDLGIYGAMNYALSVRSHNLIWFMNSGDAFYSNSSLATAVEHMQMHDTNLIIGGYGYFSKANREHLYVRRKRWVSRRRFALNIRAGCHQAMLFDLTKVDRIAFNTEYVIAADFDFVLQVMKVGKAYRLDIPLALIETGGVSDINFKQGLSEKSKARRAQFGLLSAEYLFGGVQNIGIIFKSSMRWLISRRKFVFFQDVTD